MNVDIAELIKGIVQDYWNNNDGNPIFLSEIGSKLSERSIDNYKDYTSGRGLSRFIEDALSSELEVKKHPFQRSKIVVYPKGENYAFPDESDIAEPSITELSKVTPISKNYKSRNTRLIRLISAFDCLSEEELKDVQIPFYILVKLAR